MRLLVLGCGSMGKRRVRDLLRLRAGDVVAFDAREDRRREVSAKFGVSVPGTLEEALALSPDALIVCLPPNRHAEYIERGPRPRHARIFGGAHRPVPGRHKPHHPAGAVLQSPRGPELHLPALPVQRQAGGGGPTKTTGSSTRPTARAAALCVDVIIHMLHLARSLTGEVSGLACLAAKRAGFESPGGFDTYDLLLDTRSGAGVNLHCDVVARPYTLIQRATFENGAVNWTWNSCEIFRPGAAPEPVPLPEGFQFEDVYAIELRHFLDAIGGAVPYMHSLEAEKASLEVILAAEAGNIPGRDATRARTGTSPSR